MSFPVMQDPGHRQNCNSIIHNIREDMEYKARGDNLFNIIMKVSLAAIVPLGFIFFKIPAKIARNNGDEEKEREYSKLTIISFAVQAINMVASYFIAGTNYFTPDCFKECTYNGFCGGYFDFFSCHSCVNKCESSDSNPLLKIAFIYLPFTIAITGFIGKFAENTLVKLFNAINRPQIQKKINCALDTMGPGISIIDILKSCQDQGIDRLSQPIENYFFREINEDVFEDLWKYSIEHERDDLKQKCLEFLKSNGSDTVRAITGAWEGEPPEEIARLF